MGGAGIPSEKNGVCQEKVSHRFRPELPYLRLSIPNLIHHHPPSRPSSSLSASAKMSKVEAVKQELAAKVDPSAPTGLALYSRFAFAGAVCCSVTHGALTPVDVYVSPPLMRSPRCQWLRRALLCPRALHLGPQNDDARMPS